MKFTLVQVEMDGNDAGAIARGLLDRFVGGRVAEPARPAEVRAPALLAAPKKVYSRKGAKAAKNGNGGTPAVEAPTTVTGAIREAIAAGPKTNLEVLDYVTSRGLTSSSSTISTILCQMRAKNEITKFDSDLRWRPAVKPAR